ncbi:MAG: hypothetical protein R2738_04055 [Bacteroides graminisolvens]
MQVNDDFGETAAILITLESDQKTYRELERYLEGLEDKLRTVDAVATCAVTDCRRNKSVCIWIKRSSACMALTVIPWG